ncbi:MAG TPA: SDR family oxidoreductase [Acidimicrobiales bacterium]|nr:SDR family oxidoreductase [Acidimicrobiales bacterium]
MAGDTETGGVLAGKVAAVTGATSGSGRAIAQRFAQEGAHVYLLARGPERLKELEAQLGSNTTGLATDVGDPDSVNAAFDHIAGEHGRLDILINNAAVYRPCPLESLSDEDILTQVRTNLLGPIYTCRAAIPLMRAAGGGDIVNTSSESTLDPFPHLSVYVSTKAALEAFSHVLRSEVEPEGIRVSTVVQGACAPGEGGGSIGWEWDPEHAEAAMRVWSEGGWLGRVAKTTQTVDDIADVHVFLVTRPRGQKLEVVHVRSF